MAEEEGINPLEELRERATALVSGAVADAIEGVEMAHGQLALRIKAERIKEICFLLRDGPGLEFDLLSSVTAVDWLMRGRKPRFQVVYHLWSIQRRHRICLKCDVPEETPEIDSVCEVWGTANWHERETYDFFGIVFRDHPDLRRIIMPEDWKGWPLRKDFPVGGTKSFYFKRETHPHAGEPEGFVPRIRAQESDI